MTDLWMLRPSKSDERYPYTYACDWLRMCDLAHSRSEAASLYDGYDEACFLADQYCLYYKGIYDAEEILKYSKKKLGEIYGSD